MDIRVRVRVSVSVRFCGHYVDIVAGNRGRLRLQPTVTPIFAAFDINLPYHTTDSTSR